MRILTGILFWFVFNSIAFGQSFERKIIVENGTFYYVTVDENMQIGTLYKGGMDTPLKEAKSYAIPAGRGISAETNPLAWDVDGENMFAINFMDHSLNDRNESIKKFPINKLKLWSSGVEVGEVIMESIDNNNYVLNEPYLFIKKRSIYLNHFYFDAVVFDSAYFMAIANNDEITFWRYKNHEWKHSEVKSFPISGAFSLMVHKKELYLITNKTVVYKVGISKLNQVQLATNGINLSEITLVEDRDKGEIYYVKNNLINLDKSLNEIIQLAGVKFIKE